MSAKSLFRQVVLQKPITFARPRLGGRQAGHKRKGVGAKPPPPHRMRNGLSVILSVDSVNGSCLHSVGSISENEVENKSQKQDLRHSDNHHPEGGLSAQILPNEPDFRVIRYDAGT